MATIHLPFNDQIIIEHRTFTKIDHLIFTFPHLLSPICSVLKNVSISTWANIERETYLWNTLYGIWPLQLELKTVVDDQQRQKVPIINERPVVRVTIKVLKYRISYVNKIRSKWTTYLNLSCWPEIIQGTIHTWHITLFKYILIIWASFFFITVAFFSCCINMIFFLYSVTWMYLIVFW